MTEQKANRTWSRPSKLLRSYANASLDAICIKDRESRWRFANPALLRITGKPWAELLGKTDAEVYSDLEIGQKMIANDRKVMDSGKAETFEEFVDLADGRHYFIAVKSPRFDEKGNVNGIVVISHDITNRKKREEQLRESQQKYKALIETTSDFVWELDPDGNYTYCSPQMEKLWGLKPNEMIGKSAFARMPPEAREEGTKFFNSMVASQKPFKGIQVPSFDSQGNLIYIEISGVPFFDDKGKLLGFRGISRDVTERRKAEEQLKDSKDRYQFLVETPNSIVMTADRNLNITYVNKFGLEFFGYSLEEVLGKNVIGTTVPRIDSGGMNLEEMTKEIVRHPEKYRTNVHQNMLKDGTLVWISWSNSIRYDKEGNVQEILAVGNDISKLKEAEETLQASEEKFSKAFNNSPNAITITRLSDGKIIEGNESSFRLFGYSHEEVIGKTTLELRIWSDLNDRLKLAKTLASNGVVQNMEFVLRKKDGTLFPVNLCAALITVAGEKCFLSSFLDLTERKKTEEALEESEYLYKTVFDNNDDGFVLVEPIYDENHNALDLRFLQLNLAYERQTGTKAVKVEGRRAKDIAPNLEQSWISLCGEVAKTQKSRRIEDFNQHTGKWYDAQYIPFTKGRVGILFRDITNRKNLEKQLQDKERLAGIGATAGMVGHDIRNPLQAILSDTYLLKSELTSMPECETKESVAESLKGIESNVNYINKIVQDLQDYARPLAPSAKEIDLENIFEGVLVKRAVPKRIVVSCIVEPEAKKLTVDPDLLKRVLANLVNNAVQAMPEGGNLTIRGCKDEKNVIISVKDTGLGVPEEVKAKLFTPLFTTKSKGQGFGLAVVKRLTEAMDGTVTFESEAGKGTSFTIRLHQNKNAEEK